MSFLDPVLSPLLKLEPLFALIIITFFLSICITLTYKYTTDQKKLKFLKEKLKKYQKQMRNLKEDPEKMMKVNQKAMKLNLEFMKSSMKSTLYTFIPIILIFGWLSSHFAYYPLLPNEEFTITAEIDDSYTGDLTLYLDVEDGINFLSDKTVTPENNLAYWQISGDEGIYILKFKTDNSEIKEKKIQITSTKQYEEPVLESKGIIEKITIGNKKIQPFHGTPIQNIPWIGNFGWFGTYFLFSVLFSISIRKLLKVY